MFVIELSCIPSVIQLQSLDVSINKLFKDILKRECESWLLPKNLLAPVVRPRKQYEHYNCKMGDSGFKENFGDSQRTKTFSGQRMILCGKHRYEVTLSEKVIQKRKT